MLAFDHLADTDLGLKVTAADGGVESDEKVY